VPAGLEPLVREGGEAGAVEAVERVADCHQLEGTPDIEVFGSAGPPIDVSGSSFLGEGLGVADRLFLLVDGEDISEVLGQGKGDPAWPTRKVQEPAGAAQGGPVDEVVDQLGWVRNPVPVVVMGRAPIQVGPELGSRVHTSVIVAATADSPPPPPPVDQNNVVANHASRGRGNLPLPPRGAKRVHEYRLSVSGDQSTFSRSVGEATVKSGHSCVCLFGGQEHAAVGQLEAGLGSEQGEAVRGVFGEVLGGDVQLVEHGAGPVEVASAGGPDEDLGKGEWAGLQRLAGGVGQQRGGTLVMAIAGIQVCDQHAGIEDDHSGQSLRRRSR
jgi:hypothetical protein